MTTRSRKTWSIFGGCLLLVGLALFWVTCEVLGLERREAEARREAQVHESMRLALWRMDSAFAPILAQEAARAPSTMSWPPLLPHFEAFRLYFSIDATGKPSSPEIAPFIGWLRPGKGEAEKAVEELERAPASRPADGQRDSAQVFAPSRQHAASPQIEQSKEEYQSRVKMAQQAQQNVMVENTKVADEVRKLDLDASIQTLSKHVDGPPMPEYKLADSRIVSPTWVFSDAESSAIEARWLMSPARAPDLFLVRTIRNRNTGHETVQGIWCDWPKLEHWLLDHTRDLFENGALTPAPSPAETDQAALLATIPARFVPGSIRRTWKSASIPTRLILLVAWVAALGAVAAVGFVLRAAMNLGERRGRFVSAVTHELRTPLTTFRMYSQMLADGMVPEGSHGEYLETLKQESERLSRVVESVLLYSRLEEGRGGAHREVISCRTLLDRILPTVRKRALDGGMAPEISVDVSEDARLEVDVQAVEQILLNLVDNACKYAQPSDSRILVSCRTTVRVLEVTCRDFGPGIPENEREAVFFPFRRGESHAAGTTPGVGLGLSLARGLAQALGGDLVLQPSGPGACFILTIPRARTG